MAKSLHDYTALLPVVEVRQEAPALPGESTRQAIEAGVLWAVAGGVLTVTERMIAHARTPRSPTWIWTGGDSPLLLGAIAHAGLTGEEWTHEPALTLEGLRLSVEARS
jgi:pantothenate kinase type III